MQTTSNILMIRPVNFGFNAETAVNNSFQRNLQNQDTQSLAREEFDALVKKLRENEINTIVLNDSPEPFTPDSIFPNNWVSFHEDGTVVLYPMFAVNRRAERKQAVLEHVFRLFEKKQLLDLTAAENRNHYLEGTGSLVLDRINKIAYACLSPRTDIGLVEEFCKLMQYQPCTFHAYDADGGLIYHTNVLMCVAEQFVVLCLEAIRDEKERSRVISTIKDSGKQRVVISTAQMNAFAGNMLQVRNTANKPFLVMSSQAYHSLDEEQKTALEKYNPIIHSNLSTIESNGGGSARCMMAEIYLPEKSTIE